VAGETEYILNDIVLQHSHPGDPIIYTDGSVIREKKSSCGFVVYISGSVTTTQYGAFETTTSSMRMGIEAVTKALRWLEKENKTSATVITDSQNLLKKVINRWLRREWIESITNSHIISLTWIYCPSHAGVRGNEIADRLAGKATVNDILAMDKSDLQTAILQRLQLQETNEFKQSAYYKRFEELRITEGSGKLLELFSKSRAIYNQHAIGITTTPTLREILKLRPSSYECPGCNDATL
jgi:ribonuclease HI